jgi:prevent-host-death family protein
MYRVWQLQEAKARFSELFTKVIEDGPQMVSRHGKQTIVLLKETDYRALRGQSQGLVEFLLSAPKLDLELERDPDSGRDIDI